MDRMSVAGVVCRIACLVAALRGTASAVDVAPQALEHFEKKIRPVLVQHCFKCHSAEAGKKKGGLHLDTREGLRTGGDTGPALVPGDPDASLIIKALRRTGDVEMPPDDPLPAAVVADFEHWIRQGAADPRDGKRVKPPSVAELAATHWSFQRPTDPTPPPCGRVGWCRTSIDNFVLGRMTAEGLTPAPTADRRTLIRRASYDLLGVPPTTAEIEAFVADRSPQAWALLLDRLLASPRYGERWGRHWLDVARYSDTKGYVFREERRYPFAWTYRDWVIRALNEDLPYDQFLIQQLAADRLPAVAKDPRPLAALGFLTLGRRFLNREPDIIDDRIDVVTRGTLGLTVACARCHDHKYDPIPTKDYYALYGVFASAEEPKELPVITTGKKTAETIAYDKELAARRSAVDGLRTEKHAQARKTLGTAESIAAHLQAAHEAKAITDDEALKTLAGKHDVGVFMLSRWRAFLERAAKSDHPLHATVTGLGDVAAAKTIAALLAAAPSLGADSPLDVPLSDAGKIFARDVRDKLTELDRKVEELKATHPGAPVQAHALVDRATPHDPRVFIRGNPESKGDAVPRRFLTALAGPEPAPFRDGSGRLELARAIASADNPLTARVMVNRVWLGHFGVGLVRTPSDFGVRGDPPTHPELLDWLAHRFVAGGWSLKKLHRLILLSATYQQASDAAPEVLAKDPTNLYLARMNRRRLDFEAMRDGLLATARRLDTTTGGRAVPFVLNPSARSSMVGETIRNDSTGDPSRDVHARRRSVYLFIDRQNLPGIFRDFDFASPDAHSPQRYATSVPQQALFLMNSPFVVEQARAVVSRPEVTREKDPARKLTALWRAVHGRVPRADEVELARRYLDAPLPQREPLADSAAAWQYGSGSWDAAARRVAGFSPLPHFTGAAWQAGKKMPDESLGWVMLSAGGGHPGKQGRAAIRRWVAPREGEITIAGTLAHGSPSGDGIEARIVSSRGGELAGWTVHDGEAETRLSRVRVKQGEAFDFVVSSRGDDSFDGFTWSPTVRMRTTSASTGAEMTVEWSASGEFAGPGRARSLSGLERLAQVLLVSNEFMFVD